MKDRAKKKRFYFKYIFIFIILSTIILVLLDIFVFKTTNMTRLKEQRRDNLINFPKDKSIKIGVVWPFFSSVDGADYFREGVNLAVKELNKKKLLGREVEVIFKDDKWEIEVAKDIANEFANDRDIVAVIAHDDIDLAIPASITYEYAGVVMIAPAVSSPNFTRVGFDYIFRNTPSDTVIGQKLADFAKFMNYRKIVILNSRDLYSKELTEIFKQRAIENELEVVYDNQFNKNERSFSEILINISPKINHSIDYDAIFVAGDEENVPSLIQKAREHGIFAPFLTGDMLDTSTILEAGDAMNGTIVATIYNNQLLNEKTQNFIDKFQKVYHISPDTWAAQGYDAVILLAHAIEKTKSLDPKMIANQLKYMSNFESIFGKYSLNTKGDVIDRDIYFKVVEDGNFKYLNAN